MPVSNTNQGLLTEHSHGVTVEAHQGTHAGDHFYTVSDRNSSFIYRVPIRSVSRFSCNRDTTTYASVIAGIKLKSLVFGR